MIMTICSCFTKGEFSVKTYQSTLDVGFLGNAVQKKKEGVYNREQPMREFRLFWYCFELYEVIFKPLFSTAIINLCYFLWSGHQH